MKQEVQKIRISNKSKMLIQIPLIENDIQKNIKKIKQRYGVQILIGCIISSFGAAYSNIDINSYISTQEYTKNIINSSLYSSLSVILGSLIPQLLIGFTVDLISLKTSWIFSLVISTIGIVLNLASLIWERQQGLLLGELITNIGYSCIYTCVTFMLYDSSFNLRRRFNNAGLLQVFAYYVPKVICLHLNIIYQQDNKKISLIINSISILFVIGGSFFIYIQYGKIENERQKSQLYMQFLQHQGVGITLKKIINYYYDKNIIFLLIMSFVTALATSRWNPNFYLSLLEEKDSNQLYEYLINISYLFCIFFPGILLLFYVNSRKYIIEYCMRATRYLLISSLIVQFIICLIIYFFDSISYYEAFALFFLCSAYQGSVHLLFIIIYNQVLTCLQDDRISIKCFGFALISVMQDISQIFFLLDIQPINLSLIIFLIIILTKVYSEYFLYNKTFMQLEQQINNSYDHLNQVEILTRSQIFKKILN